jgi:hypothetical protein
VHFLLELFALGSLKFFELKSCLLLENLFASRRGLEGFDLYSVGFFEQLLGFLDSFPFVSFRLTLQSTFGVVLDCSRFAFRRLGLVRVFGAVGVLCLGEERALVMELNLPEAGEEEWQQRRLAVLGFVVAVELSLQEALRAREGQCFQRHFAMLGFVVAMELNLPEALRARGEEWQQQLLAMLGFVVAMELNLSEALRAREEGWQQRRLAMLGFVVAMELNLPEALRAREEEWQQRRLAPLALALLSAEDRFGGAVNLGGQAPDLSEGAPVDKNIPFQLDNKTLGQAVKRIETPDFSLK